MLRLVSILLLSAAIGIPMLPLTAQAEKPTMIGAEAEAELPDGVPLSTSTVPPWSMFKWTLGPETGKLGDLAEVNLPKGYMLTDAEGTQKILQLLENPTSGNEMGLIMPDRPENQWIAIFEYDESGYVSDEEKDDIDAEEILESIQEGNEYANEARRERDWAEVQVTGWAKEPFYNRKTNNLEWSIRGASEGQEIINYDTRLLGRGGVMSVTLLSNPENLATNMPEYTEIVEAFRYAEGNRYGDYREGDKIAEYGLIALMAGGGAAIAAKTGLLAQLALIFKKAWKFLIVGVAAAGAGIKKFFGRLTGRAEE
jgi:uncharacterized membrane-anchored protein